MKYLSVLLVLVMITSCCNCEDKKYNPTGIDPSSMSEKELYLTYGLEVPDDFYLMLQSQIEKKEIGIELYCAQLQIENQVSHLVNVAIQVDSLEILTASVTRSDYSNKVNKLIENIVIGREWTYETEKHSSGDFDFRLDLQKLCVMKR
ncbi:MAG: hypothetical protein KA408_01320 [Flavobacteriales bacterium]|nr:hypothetical protein [Flavobacteriales bacterium]